MSYSVVIPVLNEVLCLPMILDDIASQALQPDLVVAADCGSSDGTLDLINKQYPNILLVKSQVKSPASARNEGALAVDSDQIIFVDADIRIPPDLCSGLLESHERTNADISYPKFISDGKSLMGAIHVSFVRLWLWFWRVVKPEKGIGGLICIDRKVFEKLGRFDESLNKGEDVEFFMKASREGYIINYCNTISCFVSSRRTKGFGIVRTILADGPLFSRLRKNKRDYKSYK